MGVRRGVMIRVAVTAVALACVGVPAAYAVQGSTPTGPAAAATVRIEVGKEARACSGALVSPWWVLTATSCFAAAPGAAVGWGAPTQPTTVTVGRVDLDGTAGHVVPAALLVPHADRDVVLVRLATAVPDVAPVKVASTAPVTGEALTVTGYGRTSTQLVPDTAHAATYTVNLVGPGTLGIEAESAGATICKGDAGGPALRTTATGAVELVAIHHTASQGGCLGSTTTAQGATETRVDDIRDWVHQNTKVSPGADTVGVRGGATWYLNDQNDSSAPEKVFLYGEPGDTVLVGDWDGDGVDTIGVRRGATWYLNNQNDASAPDNVFIYGDPQHTPLVGDWDGDGVDTVGARLGATWYLNNQNDSSPADNVFMYGDPQHTPLVGDWDGDGVDTVGARLGAMWYLNNQNDSSPADNVFMYGDPQHTPLVGDWDGDGVDTVGARLGATWYLNNQNDSSAPDNVFIYGDAHNPPLVGNWDGR
ncbi:S1 family peptidase [Cellulomonas sp. NS3]|uniref:S1 family peptidase n=1 Tax=Cellulomonas sp. NS3 TaxID=2973977 RepID=UPI00216136A4|nr:S1 family peptidase [Cellulomonas sp. NS3]